MCSSKINPNWSKYINYLASTRPYAYIHIVGPYAYGWTVRVYAHKVRTETYGPNKQMVWHHTHIWIESFTGLFVHPFSIWKIGKLLFIIDISYFFKSYSSFYFQQFFLRNFTLPKIIFTQVVNVSAFTILNYCLQNWPISLLVMNIIIYIAISQASDLGNADCNCMKLYVWHRFLKE